MPSAFGMVMPSENRLSGSSRLSFFSATNWEKDANDERLCIATDAEVISRSERHFLFKIGVAKGTSEAASFGIPDADQCGGNGRWAAVAFERIFHDCHDRRVDGRLRPLMPSLVRTGGR